jgi:hypothetical protein
MAPSLKASDHSPKAWRRGKAAKEIHYSDLGALGEMNIRIRVSQKFAQAAEITVDNNIEFRQVRFGQVWNDE